MLALVRSTRDATRSAVSPPRWAVPRHGNGVVNRTPSDYVGRHAARPGLWARLTGRRTARRPDFVPLQRIA